jgi:DNA helicase-2/ATP-dependent DNA helicase PcrA
MNNNLLENLNAEQLKAVTHKNGPLLIVAGAGTGKTTVITQKIAYLIEQGLSAADEILALTFTEKAAAEMEERVDRLLPMGYLDLWISTFHSFSERILREHGLEIGLPADFKLLNEFEQWALVRRNLNKFNLEYYRPLGNPTKFIHALVKHFSRAKDEDISPKQYLEYAEELKENMDGMLAGKLTKAKAEKIMAIVNGSRAAGSFTLHHPVHDNDAKEIAVQEVNRIYEVAQAYHVYQQLLLDNNALDFGDLINYTLKLFRERPAILTKYRQQFKYILLDEFQDTNWAQYELIKMLAAPHNNLIVVGDDDQSIYAFRGASMSNILHFKKDYPEAREIVLVKNYRNKQNILDLAYEFIQLNNPNRLEWQLNAKEEKKEETASRAVSDTDSIQGGVSPRLSKKLVAQRKGKGKIEVIKGESLAEEISRVVEKIAELKIKDKKVSWNDFAILVRANESAKEICAILEQAELPYQFIASRGLYSKPVIMDVLAYLKMLDDYHESPALYRILNLPPFEFSYQELVNFNYWAAKKAWSLFEVLKSVAALNLGPDIQAKVERVLNLIASHTVLVREKAVSEVILAFLHDSGYLKYLTQQEDRVSQEATNYLNQFMKRVQAFEAASADKSVKAFLEELNLEIESGEQGALATDLDAGPEAIKVMTVHAAKGLEFKYVFITNLVDRRFPTIERREPIEIPEALVKEILPEGDVHLEEERRLFYVAMTRARHGLYFSWAPDYGGARTKKPSRFLAELGLVKEKTSAKKEENAELTFSLEKRSVPVADKEINLPVPSYFSYTQLAAFSNCPYQYRFAHILRIPRRGKAVFSFGKTMHSVLQKLFELVKEKQEKGQADLFGNHLSVAGGGNKVGISWKEIKELYEKSWIDDWYENKSQKEEYRRLGEKILKEFYAKHKIKWPRPLFLEKGFRLKINIGKEIFTIRGVIDRIDEVGKNKIKIIDYKTGRPKEKLSFEDKGQLLLYQLAARNLFSQEVVGLSFYYLENNTEIEFLGTTEELEKMKEKMITIIRGIQKSEFPPKPGPLCKYCDFAAICEFRQI